MECFKPPMNLRLDEHAVTNWRMFRQMFDLYLTAAGKETVAESRKVAMFLNCIGEEALHIYNNFKLDNNDLTLAKVYAAFEVYIKPKTNVVIERHKFFTRVQQPSEPFDNFVNELQKSIRSCEFGDQEESLLRDRIIIAINDEALQQRLLREPDLSLKKTLDCCRAAEISRIQQRSLKSGQSHFLQSEDSLKSSVNVDVVKKNLRPSASVQSTVQYESYDCRKCGKRHKKANCPAFGKKCNGCGKFNHFSIGCQIKNLKKVSEIQHNSPNNDYDFYVDLVKCNKSTYWKQSLEIGNKIVEFKLDTGADCNVLPVQVFQSIQFKEKPLLNKNVNVTIVSYDNSKLKAEGFVVLNCKLNSVNWNVKFVLLDTKSKPILGLNACKKMKLVARLGSEDSEDDLKVSPNINANQTGNCVEINSIDIEKQKFLECNKDSFTGFGCYPEEYKIILKENVEPVVNSCRRVPISIKPRLKEVLDKLEDSHIIEKVDYVTDWVNNITIVEKPDQSLRLCLDPRHLNNCLKPEKFPIPTIEELSAGLSGKKMFTVLDMKNGFHQIKLTDSSSDICTFITCFGKYKYKRLPFGLSTAPEVFQRTNMKIFGDIPGVFIYFDDLIIGANDELEHQLILDKVMARAKQSNVKFNPNKLQFKVKQVKYLGLQFDASGARPDASHVEAVKRLKTPNNKQELLKLLGLVNYLSKFIPNSSKLTAPLRELTKSNVEWLWTEFHTTVLDKIKHCIVNAPTLKLFDNKHPIIIQADASQNALGACLLQEARPVSFVSRSLTNTEKQYPQIEKEFLAICFALEKFHQFIYGNNVKILTDHKPIVSIIQKDMHRVTPRLQRLKLRLLRYKLQVEYLPGSQMLIADLLSRSVANDLPDDDDTYNEVVHGLGIEVSMSDNKIKEFQVATKSDDLLNIITDYFLNGWPQSKTQVPIGVVPFWSLRADITSHNGILFLNHKIIVPYCLRKEMIKLAHKPHMGIEKTTNRLRQIFYWPKLSVDVFDFVKSCKICEKYSKSNIKEPLIPQEIPDIPFEKIGIDVFYYNCNTYLAVMDYYSKWLEIIMLRNSTSYEIQNKLISLFSNHGIPKTIVCDNMPFGSYSFAKFAKEWSFEIINSSPHYPKSNGLAEKAVGIAKSILKKCSEEGIDVRAALLEYRNTPISGLNVSPAELLMSRKLRTFLPIVKTHLTPKTHAIQPLLKDRQAKQKEYYDKTCKGRKEFLPGDNVVIQNKGVWEPGVVIKKEATPRSYTVLNSKGNKIVRNSVHLKQSRNEPVIAEETGDDIPTPNDYEDKVLSLPCPDLLVVEVPEDCKNRTQGNSNNNDYTVNKRSRSGRVLRAPDRYKDFVCE